MKEGKRTTNKASFGTGSWKKMREEENKIFKEVTEQKLGKCE